MTRQEALDLSADEMDLIGKVFTYQNVRCMVKRILIVHEGNNEYRLDVAVVLKGLNGLELVERLTTFKEIAKA
jgi:hypothetical protein